MNLGDELLAAGAFATLIPIILAGATFFKGRFDLHPELARKSAHILLGLGTLAFPWLFTSPIPVWVLCVAAVFLLAAVRHFPVLRRKFGEALGADRATAGEYWFPVAIALVYDLAGGRCVLYIVPVLILSLADGLGALVGVRYGAMRYRSGEGFKSLEGSTAFFVVAFLSTHIPVLLMTEIGRLESLLLAILIGLLVMLMEAVAWRGLDNLFVPLLAFFLLQTSLWLSAVDLAFRLFLLLVLSAAALAPGKRSPLDGDARALALIFCFIFWAVGGWHWLLSALALYAAVLLLPSPPPEIQPARNTLAILRVMSGPTIFTAAFLSGWKPAADAFCLTFACHLGNVLASRGQTLRVTTSLLLSLHPLVFVPACGLAGFIVIYLPGLFFSGDIPARLFFSGGGSAALCASLFFASRHFDQLRLHREAILAPACALLAAVLS